VIAATGRELELAVKRLPDNDETLIARHMRMTPAERADHHDSAYANVRELVRSARPVDA
jgi:hypothetical protein